MVLIKTQRDTLLAPLQSVSGIVERRHTLPILSNVLLEKLGDRLTFLATDIEIQITTAAEGSGGDGDGAVTAGARKLQDILRSLPVGAEVSLILEDNRLQVRCGGIFNPTQPGAYAVTYTIGDANCHVELTRVINVEQSTNPPYLIADFALCACPDELIDLETFLLGSAPEGGNWIIQNPPGLNFVLLPPPGPGNSHAALYNDGCGISRVIYEYTDCNNNARRDTILVDFHRCSELEVATTDSKCQGDGTLSTLTNLRGCDNYIVRVFSGLIPGGSHMGGQPRRAAARAAAAGHSVRHRPAHGCGARSRRA